MGAVVEDLSFVASLSVRLSLKMSLFSVVFPLPPFPATAGGSNPVYLLGPATERADCLPSTLPCTPILLVPALFSVGLGLAVEVTSLVASLSLRLRLKQASIPSVFLLPPFPAIAGGINPVYLLAPATETADSLPFTLPCILCLLISALLSVGLGPAVE